MRFGLFSQVNKWDRENATKQYMDQLRQFANAYSNGNKAGAESRYASFLSSPDQSLAQDADLLRAAIDNGDDYAATLGVIAQKKQEAIKQTTGFGASMKYLGNMMKSIGASLMTAGIYAAISYGISKAVEWADSQVNAAKYAKEALQEVSSEWDELADKQKSAGALVEKYSDDYDRLSKGVNMVTGENLSLTDDEYELFKQINNELADSALASVQGVTIAYDEQGNAIIRLSDQMNNLSDAYQTLEQQTRSEIIKDLPEVLKNTQTALTKPTGTWGNIIQVSNWLQGTPEQDSGSLITQLQLFHEMLDRSAESDAWKPTANGLKTPGVEAALLDAAAYLGKDISKPYDLTIDDLHAFIDYAESEIYSVTREVREGLTTVALDALNSQVPQATRNLVSQYYESLPYTEFATKTYSQLYGDARALAQFINDSNITDVVANLHELQTAFNLGKIGYGDYLSRASAAAQSAIDENMPELLQQLLLDAFDLDGTSSYSTSERHLRAIISDISDEWITGLTADHLNFANSIDSGRQMTQEQFMRLYDRAQQSEQYSSSKIAKDYKTVSDANALLTEAANAQGYSMSITTEQYEQLAEAGDEYAACVRNVNGYMQLDIEASRTLIAKKQEEAKATVEAAKAYKLQQYGENARNLQLYRDVLENTTDLTEDSRKALEDKISALESEQAVIRSDIDAYNRLGSEIEYATSSYKKWLDAQDAPEAGDAYANMRTAMEQIKEGQKSGKIGTAKYKAAVELLVPEGKDVQEYMKTLGEYITEDSDGIWKFVDDMFARGFLSKDANGRYSFMQGVTVEDIAQGLGLTDELTQYMLQALQDYGWNVDLADRKYTSDDVLKEYDKAIANTKAKEEELARVMADANATAAEKAKAQAELAEAQAKEKEVAAKVKVVTDGEMTLEEQLQAEIQRWKDAIAELEAINVPVAGVITSFTTGEEANDPNDFVSQLQAFITWYDSGKDANDPNDFVSQLQAFIASYNNGEAVNDPNEFVSQLQAFIASYDNGPEANDPNDFVSQLQAFIVGYENGAGANDPNDFVSGLGAIIAWYETGPDANDPNELVAQLQAYIAGYANGEGVSPDDLLVNGLIATIESYINGENVTPDGLVAALSAYVASYADGEDTDPNTLVDALHAVVGSYADSGVNDPNALVAALAATINSYTNGEKIDPNTLVAALKGKVSEYVNTGDPNALVAALVAYVKSYSNATGTDPSTLVSDLKGTATVTITPDDQASDDIQAIEDGDYAATIKLEVDPADKAAVEAEIKALQEQSNSMVRMSAVNAAVDKFNGDLDYALKALGLSMDDLVGIYSNVMGVSADASHVRSYYATRNGFQDDPPAKLNASTIEAIVVAMRESNGNITKALETVGITMDEAVAAYEALYKAEIPADSNAHDELMAYLVEHTSSSSDIPKENPPVVKPKEDQRSLEQKRADFDAAMLETAGDFDAALSKAAVSMDELIAELTASYAKNPYIPNDRPVDESAVHVSAIGTYHQNVMHQIEAAVKTAGGDLSVALNELGMSYDQALEHFQQSALSYGIGVKPDEADLGDLQDYLEQETTMDVLVGLKTDEATQQLTAFVNEAEKREFSLTAKVTGIWNGITGFTGRLLARGTKHAKDEDAVVGENGVETILSGDRFYTVGHNGPEFVHLNEGDQVLTNSETKRLFRGSSVPRKSGRAYAAGTGLFQSAVAGASSAVTAAAAALGALFGLNGKNNTDVTGGGDDQRKKDSNKNRGPDYNAILKKFEQLHDWITRALDVAEKRTQALVDSVKDFVGYMAQNKQLDKALESTRKEIELNQQAYVRYMQQAADVQDQLDLSDEIVRKIHEGVIDIESYDETTQKKIAEYQEWYEKAENCKDAIEELKDQERELQLQRMDNIIEDYENRLDYISDQSEKVQREIEYQRAVGMEVQASSYEELIQGEQKKIAALQRERLALESEFNNLVASGVIEVGSEDWHKYRNEIEGVDGAIHDATISAQEFADEIYNLNLSKLQNLNKVLQSIQSSTEGILSLHDAQGTKNVAEYYETLILNGHDQIANLEDQNKLIREQMKGLDTDSEKYRELLDELTANEEAITGIKVSQEQWNDSIADLKIESLQDEREALEKTNEAYQKQLDLEEALEALAKAKNQRTKLVYREGVGFVYEADQEAIDAAQKQVDDLMHRAKLDAIDDQIDAIEDNKENDNVWSYDGSTLLKSDGLVPDAIYSAIQEMLTAALPEEVYAQTAVAEALQTASAPIATQISIGDIIISDATNAEALAKDIVNNLPNAILQEMHKS